MVHREIQDLRHDRKATKKLKILSFAHKKIYVFYNFRHELVKLFRCFVLFMQCFQLLRFFVFTWKRLAFWHFVEVESGKIFFQLLQQVWKIRPHSLFLLLLFSGFGFEQCHKGGIEAWRVCSIEYCSSDNPDAEAQHNPCRTQQCVKVCFLDHFQSIKLFQTTWGSFVMPCANCIIHSIRKLTIGWRFKGKGRSYSCEKVPRRCN